MRTKTAKVYKQIEFFVSSFVDKELTLAAASLSFYTIFTIIPLLLIIFTLLTTLPNFEQYYNTIKLFIFSNLLPVNSEVIMQHIDEFLANSAKMGKVGLVTVFIASLLFFKNFEFITNKVFHASQRSFLGSLKTYIILLTLTPITLGTSFFITGYIASLMASNSLTSSLNILPFLPYILIWGLFFLIFQISANVKVATKASLLSAFIVAIVFSVAKNAFIYYVFLNKSYTTMYGSFAMLMFLFLWIYVSWIIFIYGLKLCYIFNQVYQKEEHL